MPLKRQRNAASSDPMVGRVRSREVHPNRVRPGVGEGSTLMVAGGDFRDPGGRVPLGRISAVIRADQEQGNPPRAGGFKAPHGRDESLES